MQRSLLFGSIVSGIAAFAGQATAQFAGNVVVPQSRSVVTSASAFQIGVTAVDAEIDVDGVVAVTALTIHLQNPAGTIQEVELLMPVPEGAVVRGFDFEGKAAEPTARVLPKDEAKSTYQSLVARVKDPALLEFAGRATVRSSVFPVPARGTQKVRLVYEHVLASDGDRIDYELPRSESMQSCWIPWRVEARIKGAGAKPIATIYSPTHAFETLRASDSEVRLRLGLEAAREPGPIQFSFLMQGDGINASFYAYPDPTTDGGYFLLLGGVPVRRDAEKEKSRKREVIVVLDTSGSMAGPKIEQAKKAALQVLEGLDDGERFNVIDYDDQVSCFASEPLVKNEAAMKLARAYVSGLKAEGATNLHGALMRALSEKHEAAMIPIVLFLTDGLPTTGKKDETGIREDAEKANVHDRRIFTFGVGDDVNAPLLDRLADASRATSAYVRPSEDVEKRISEVFARLKGPILAEPRLAAFDAGEEGDARADHRIADVMPARLPDLYDGDELLLLGRYRGKTPIEIEIAGDYLGESRSFRFRLAPEKASLQAAFVPRLWASRRIGSLVDELRQSGADPATAGSAIASNPAHAEIANEIYRLSSEYGIMTEYTAFLALEGTDLSASATNVSRMNQQLQERLRRVRSGRSAIAQSQNTRQQVSQQRLNLRNVLVDEQLQKVEVGGIAQVGDRAFYKRGDRWVDARLARTASEAAAKAEVISFGSERHATIVERLLAQGRQGVIALRGEVLLEIDGKPVILAALPVVTQAAAVPARGVDAKTGG